MGKRKEKPVIEEPAPEPEPPAPEVVMIVWDGVTIECTYKPVDIMAFAHLELRVIDPPKCPIPVTETGYRSQFLRQGQVEEGGGVEAFTLNWLNQSAKTADWKKREASYRQLDLFS